MRAQPWARAVLACSLVLASCRQAQRPPPALPDGPEVVEVRMREYGFAYDRPIAAGRVLFRLRNAGRLAHSLTMLPLTDDVPPIDQQLRSTERRAIPPFAGVATLAPGTSTTFAVDTLPGARYAFVCFLIDDQGISHAVKGMNSEFRAGRVAEPETGG